MGVRTLAGVYDGTTEAAVMIDSSSGWPVGPIWEADDAYDQIEAFLAWLRTRRFMAVAEEIDLGTVDLPASDGTDPRMWPNSGLVKLIAYWRRTFLDEDGNLSPVLASSD